MLVGTDAIRAWIGLKDPDDGPNQKIADLSGAIQKFIENQCGRNFEAKLYKTDPANCYFDGTGQAFIFVPNFPIWYVNEVSVDGNRDFGAGTLVATNDIFIYEEMGKIVSEGGFFYRGRRNVRLEYYAGYGTGTHVSHDGQGTVGFGVPLDLQQTIVEMVTLAFKEGITAVHTVEGREDLVEPRIIQMLGKNSVWRKTINAYKDLAQVVGYGFDTS